MKRLIHDTPWKILLPRRVWRPMRAATGVPLGSVPPDSDSLEKWRNYFCKIILIHYTVGKHFWGWKCQSVTSGTSKHVLGDHWRRTNDRQVHVWPHQHGTCNRLAFPILRQWPNCLLLAGRRRSSIGSFVTYSCCCWSWLKDCSSDRLSN